MVRPTDQDPIASHVHDAGRRASPAARMTSVLLQTARSSARKACLSGFSRPSPGPTTDALRVRSERLQMAELLYETACIQISIPSITR